MDIEEKINEMINLNEIGRFENELNDKKTDDGRKDNLRKIVNSMRNKTEEGTKGDLDEYFARLVKNQYKKRWSSLSDELKRDRIKLYCDERELDDKMVNDIEDLYENGRLNGKMLDYDVSEGKIVSIKI